ncbi:hypothetical protein ABZP36_015625 [Zizania latifolia]
MGRESPALLDGGGAAIRRLLSRGATAVLDQSVVDDEVGKSNGVQLANACKTAVVWIRTQLTKNQTKEVVLQHINQLCDGLPSRLALRENHL